MKKYLIDERMKRLFCVIVCMVGIIGNCQNLTLDEVLVLRKKDLAGVEEYLTNKNWSFLSAADGDDDTMSSASFAYKKGDYNDRAESFLNYLYSDYSGRKRISLQVSNQDKYNLYLTKIKSFGCKLLKSDVKDGEVEKVYQGSTTTFIVSVSTQQNDYGATRTLYNFLILDNSDYELNFSDE